VRLIVLLAAILGLASCSAPPSFRVVDLAEAQRAAETGAVSVVEALELQGRAADPKAAEVPAGRGVLVFGMDERAARARAAAFARAGNQPVLVFVPRDAEERGRFYAVASRDREDRSGKDS
jgi:hypothetical protein